MNKVAFLTWLRRLARRRVGRTERVRAMFVTWLTLVAIGLVTYSIVGLTHH
jgi:hypothetical protein